MTFGEDIRVGVVMLPARFVLFLVLMPLGAVIPEGTRSLVFFLFPFFPPNTSRGFAYKKVTQSLTLVTLSITTVKFK